MEISGTSALGVSGPSSVSGRSVTPPVVQTSSASGPTFDQTLGQVVNDAIGVVQDGEAAAIQGVQGAMSPFKVVEAVMGAQRTLQQALSIRDKVVSAYQEISRMAI